MEVQNCFYRISVKALISNEEWKVLLCKESSWKWDFPWGWLDHWEKSIICLERESKEEMWLKATFISQNPKYFITAHKPESKTRPWIANVFYEVKVKNLDFISSDECVEIWFFSFEEIKKLDILPNVLALVNTNLCK